MRKVEDKYLLTYPDGFAGGLHLGAHVEISDAAEAALAVLDDGDGVAPPPEGVLRRVLGLQLEVPLQIPLHYRRGRPPPSSPRPAY